MRHDALVVGSGPNGLAAAITLAQSGSRVLVLEAAERPGGAVATEELTLPGFHHDTFSSVYPAGAASPVFARMPLERHGCAGSIRRPATRTRSQTARPSRCTAISSARPRASTRVHPGDGERWRAFAAPLLAHFDALRRTMLGGFPPVRGIDAARGGAGPARRLLDFARLLLMPAQALGEGLFDGDGTRAWLYGSAMHSDVPPAARGSAIAAAYTEPARPRRGLAQPRGRRRMLADALVSYLEELGGTVRTGATVIEARRRARPRRGRGAGGGRAAARRRS